ncbi:MAG: winged helix-turn-helix domain-containing protein, partial [Firmicutes bacterium]|nr:winged helix-turn-helix domain-containing protein [Bacillota bacterium]
TYEELFEIAMKRGYKGSTKLKHPGMFRHRIKEDIARREGDSIFQVTGYRQVGLKEWNLPDFNLDEYKKTKKEELEKNKKVSIINATIEALKENGQPMRVKEIFDFVVKRERVSFKTKTPFKTVNSNITHEINKKGDLSRFVRLSKGLIGLKEWYKA